MYEVIIGSGGLVQIGWTLKQQINEFSSEFGVGDTKNSYSYDGHRQKCWNCYCREYGGIWQIGDVISAFIDLDSQTISFARWAHTHIL